MKVYVATWMRNVEDDPENGIIGVYSRFLPARKAIVDAADEEEKSLRELGASVDRDLTDMESEVAINICLTASYNDGGVDTYHFTLNEMPVL